MTDYYSPKEAQELVARFRDELDSLIIKLESKQGSYLSTRDHDISLLRRLAAQVSDASHQLKRSK